MTNIADTAWRNRQKTIRQQMAKQGISLESFWFDNRLNSLLETYANSQGYQLDGATPDDLLQHAFLSFMLNRYPDETRQVLGDQFTENADEWLQSYRFDRFDSAWEAAHTLIERSEFAKKRKA